VYFAHFSHLGIAVAREGLGVHVHPQHYNISKSAEFVRLTSCRCMHCA